MMRPRLAPVLASNHSAAAMTRGAIPTGARFWRRVRARCLERAMKQAPAPNAIQIMGVRKVSVVTPVTRMATQLMMIG